MVATLWCTWVGVNGAVVAEAEATAGDEFEDAQVQMQQAQAGQRCQRCRGWSG